MIENQVGKLPHLTTIFFFKKNQIWLLQNLRMSCCFPRTRERTAAPLLLLQNPENQVVRQLELGLVVRTGTGTDGDYGKHDGMVKPRHM
jgi:hypothetical protein